MVCRSKIVLCIPLVLKVTVFMGRWRYSVMVEVLCSSFLCVGLFGAVVGFWLEVPCVRCQFFYCSSMVCLYLDVFMGGFRWGIMLGAGKAMLMRGGACATELCLMVGCVCECSSTWCWLLGFGCWGCVFFFLVFGVFCALVGLNLYGFGGGCVISIGWGVHWVSIIEMCWCGNSGTGLCGCASMGLFGVCVFGSVCWCVWCVGGVLSLFYCVFLFFVCFVLVLVRAFLCFRRCMFCYGVPGPLYCGGLIGTLWVCLSTAQFHRW
jgi:hypothetical protein